MPGFERIIAVDGSASSTPKRGADSIWISVAGTGVADPVNPPTRAAAFTMLAESCAAPGRTLLVVDWSLGHPVGTAAAFGLDDTRPAWAAIWAHLERHVVDGDRNENNRFEIASELNARTVAPGPYWGAPAAASTDHLPVKKQPFVDVAEWRSAERRLRADRRWPKSCWQLAGAGSVASQSLLGIARLARLRRALERAGRRVEIWPFESGLRPAAAEVDVVIAEFWPALLVDNADLPAHWIRDAAQVDRSVRILGGLDADDALDPWFAPTVDDPGAVVDEEGWILGLT